MTADPQAAAAEPQAQPRPTWERPPFFVVGYVRSGTTLFRRMLDAHPELFVLFEMDEFQRLPPLIGPRVATAAQLKKLIEGLPRYYKRQFDLEQFETLARARLPVAPATAIALLKGSARVAMTNPGIRWGHKEPHEWPYVYALRDWYPGSQFLHIVRRPHDVVASVKHYEEKGVGLHHLPTTPTLSAWHWRESVRSVAWEGATLGPDRYMRLRYEDLAAHPAATLEAVARFLKVAPGAVPQMLDYHKVELRGHKGEHMERAREAVAPPKGPSRGAKALSETQLRDIDWICRREIDLLGYKPLAKGRAGLLRRLLLEFMCGWFWIAWRSLRTFRRLRGSL